MALFLVTAPATEPVTVAEAKTHCRIDSALGEPAPTLCVATLAAVPIAGNVEAGTHKYLVTFVTADGETDAGQASAAVTVVDKAVNGKVELTAIALGGSAVTSRKVYRQFNATGTFKLQSTISNNTATTLTDNTANASLGADAPSTNTTSDPYVIALIQTAREYCETFTHRAFITQTWDLKLDAFPCADEAIWLPKAPAISVTSVTYTDTAGASQTWSSALYTTDLPTGPLAQRARIVPAYAEVYPSTRAVPNAVTVRFVAGYGAASLVPQSIKAAMKILIGTWYDAGRSSVVIGETVQEVPRTIDALLWPYKAF